ncbi:hypothetical protein QOZ80_4BG0359780 [Eleusine coracana subsp. coracana]|nr:hypothetical protein QOZ80_4BG0359780 [Eleusine coracana subsp. coracana]
MVGKGSPKLNMMRRVSLKLSLMAASVSKKKKSPKCSQVKKIECSSPRAKKRAYWNRTLDKSLVDIMLEHLRNGERADNGWNSEVWNKMYNEFLAKNKYVTYTKNQVQDRERELKRDYKLLKDAKRESGCSWNYDRQMLDADPHQWKNLIVSYPRIKKFENAKASFPLFDDLGELYDGQLAEGTYNITSGYESLHEPLRPIGNTEIVDLDEVQVVQRLQGDDDNGQGNGHMLERRNDSLSREEDAQAAGAERRTQQRRSAGVPKEDKEPNKAKKGAKVESMMERYLALRTKQVEDESAQLAREKEGAEEVNFSIPKCISLRNKMDVTKEEKVKAFTVFKSQENREIFASACNEDQESAMMWLRSEMM